MAGPLATSTPVAHGAVDRELLDALAEELAWKLNHPQQFTDGVRGVLARYAEAVGGEVSGEVRKAMEL